MRAKYIIYVILLALSGGAVLNAHPFRSDMPPPIIGAGDTNRSDSPPEQAKLQVWVTREGDKTVITIKGAHSSLPANGMGVISLKKLSGTDLERGRLVDIRRVAIKNSAVEARFIYGKNALMPGIYIAWLKKNTDVDRPENFFEPAIFMAGPLAETEKYYNRGSQDVYNFFMGITNMYKSVRELQTPDPSQPAAETPEAALKRISAELKHFRQLKEQINETVLESIHIESFGLLSAMLQEYGTVIDSLAKDKPLENRPLRPDEGSWSLPFNDINIQRAGGYFSAEILLKTSLEIKMMLAELKDLPDEASPEVKLEPVRNEIDLLKTSIKDYPQTYVGVITAEKAQPLRNIVELADGLMTLFEKEWKEQRSVSWDETTRDILKKIETLQ